MLVGTQQNICLFGKVKLVSSLALNLMQKVKSL